MGVALYKIWGFHRNTPILVYHWHRHPGSCQGKIQEAVRTNYEVKLAAKTTAKWLKPSIGFRVRFALM
jgi:hypothetical protein